MESQYIYQLISLVLLIAVAIFAFLIPSVREKKRLQKSMDMLRPGDKVVTKNGLTGRVVSVGDDTLVIAVAPQKVNLEIAKWGVKEVSREG